MAKKYTNTAREWFNTIVWGGLIAIIFRSFLLEPFNIPSGSMIPTLEVGDHIFVKKWSYGYSRNSFPFGSWNLWNGRFLASEPEVGDIVVFRKPNDTIDYVKRLVGRSGDTIQMIGGRLHINGKEVPRENPRPYIIANLPRDMRSVGYFHQDMFIKGDTIYRKNKPVDFNYTIEYKTDCMREMCGIIDATEWTEILPNGVRHSIVEISDAADYDNTPLFKVPDGHYFFMGDDRDLSADSRSSMGAVPRDNLLGRVWFVWYSHNYYAPFLALWTWPDKIRWGKLGMGIH